MASSPALEGFYLLEPHSHGPMRRKEMAHSVFTLDRSTSFLQGKGSSLFPLYSLETNPGWGAQSA